MMKIFSVAETGNSLCTVLDLAAQDPVTVMRENGRGLVVLTLEAYNGLVETSYLLSSPVNAASLAQSLADLNAGRVVEHELDGVSDAQPQVYK